MEEDDDPAVLPDMEKVRPRWVRTAVHLLRFEEATVLRRRSGWVVRTAVPGHPGETFDLEVAGRSWFVTWRRWEGRLIADERELTEPPTAADDAAVMVLTLCTQTRKADHVPVP